MMMLQTGPARWSRHLVTMAALACPWAAQAVDTNRADVQAFVKELVKSQGFDANYLVTTLGSTTVQQSILDAMAKPAEKTKSWKDYRTIFITPERVEVGVSFWRENAQRLQRISTRTGVPAEILTAIVGVETYFGRRTGGYRLLDSLTTLAFEYPPRGRFFQSELGELFMLARDEKLDITKLTGSYAGAMGAAQFMPSSYRHFAVDGDGDGRRDLFNNWDDILASVANYFVASHWHTGQPVVTRGSIVPPFAPPSAENKLVATETVTSLGKQGVRFSTDLEPSAAAGLITLEGEDGQEYWIGFPNFYVITRYNRSAMYALAVYQLGQAIGEAVRSGPDGTVKTLTGFTDAH